MPLKEHNAPLSEPPTPWPEAHFHSDAERPKLAAACLRSMGPVHPPHAQVPRHSPDTHRPLCAHGRDALAPGPPPPAPAGSDKIVHFIAFAALAFPLARTGRFGLLPVFIGASAFGGAIELIQPTFNRGADVNDWVADIIGVLLGIAGGLVYRRIRGR